LHVFARYAPRYVSPTGGYQPEKNAKNCEKLQKVAKIE
jgi:hypothetical protein